MVSLTDLVVDIVAKTNLFEEGGAGRINGYLRYKPPCYASFPHRQGTNC
jgi:hypothetical protein